MTAFLITTAVQTAFDPTQTTSKHPLQRRGGQKSRCVISTIRTGHKPQAGARVRTRKLQHSGPVCYQCGSWGPASPTHPPHYLGTQGISACEPGLQMHLRCGRRGGRPALNILVRGVWGGCSGLLKYFSCTVQRW